MAGPYGTAVLDDFTRADSATLGAAYGSDPTGLGFHPSLAIVSNQCARGSGSFEANYTVASYAADQEAWCTLKTLPNGNGFSLQCRLANVPGVTITGYQVTMSTVGGASSLDRINNTTGGARGVTTLQAISSSVWAVNMQVALACVGSSIEVWTSTGTWSLLTSATDATYSNAGVLGLWLQNSTVFAMDDFGGGAIAAAVTYQLPTRNATPLTWRT